ncbi:MAG TPA: right-handed parallel beta-helix repeat-containing protein, partial [Candidatus Binatia bacterium]|nr:right-handed parallel beta-helix repeat-containing protein [Candidatus Binatia bacterium]
VVVRPGEDIQAALDSLPADGGCVCLKVGVHEITTPIRIENSNVSLHGETLGARVVRKNGAALLSIGDSGGLLLEHVTVSEMCFEFQNKGAQGGGLPALIAIDRCRNAKIDGCVIRAEQSGNFTGVQIGRSADIEVSHCQIENVRYGVWVVSDSTFIHIAGNLLHSTLNKNSDGGIAGVFLMDAFGPSTVEDNRITGFIFGIAINKGLLTGTPLSLANGSRITANRILRLDAESESGNVKASGIDVAANDCLIADNIVAYTAEAYGGIAASGGNASVERNLVRSLAREAGASPSIGILLGRLSAQGSLPSSGGRVAANNVLGAQDGIVLIGNTAAQVLDNRVESEGNEARFAIALSATSRACVNGNRITGAALPLVAIQGTANEFSDNTLLRGGGGATLLNQTSLEFSQNRVEDMRNYGFIAMAGLAKCALLENRFLSCGYAQAPAIGIGVSQHFGELHIESCEVMDTGVAPGNQTISPLAWGIFADYVLEARVQSNNVTYANAALLDANLEHRALWLRGFLEQAINLGAGQFVFGFSAQILDNKFLGPGRSALVETAQLQVTDRIIRRFERVFFNNNFCWHVSVAAQPAATVSLVGRSAVVMGNHIKAHFLLPSVDFHGMKDAVYMGNIAQTGPANFAGIPTPVSGFNKP